MKKTNEVSSTYLLFHEIDIESAENVVEWILENNSLDDSIKHKYLTLIINSEGGNLTSAFCIIDMMNLSNIPIKTLGTGEIMSAGLMIFMNGAKSHRVLTKNTSILSHGFSAGSQGKYHDLKAIQKEFTMVNDRMLNHYIKCTGLPKLKVEKHLLNSDDFYMSPSEALSYGICDEVV